MRQAIQNAISTEEAHSLALREWANYLWVVQQKVSPAQWIVFLSLLPCSSSFAAYFICLLFWLNWRFKTKGYLRRHHLEKHDRKQHECDECKYRAANRTKLRAHILRLHPNSLKFPCKGCDKRFFNIRQLKVSGWDKKKKRKTRWSASCTLSRMIKIFQFVYCLAGASKEPLERFYDLVLSWVVSLQQPRSPWWSLFSIGILDSDYPNGSFDWIFDFSRVVWDGSHVHVRPCIKWLSTGMHQFYRTSYIIQFL